MERKIKILAFELGRVEKNVVGGGDLIFPKMVAYFPSNVEVVVILPKISQKNWQFQSKAKKEVKYIPTTIFDYKNNLILVFFSYFVRAFNASRIAKKEGKNLIYYSSTNTFADVLAGFLAKFQNKKVKWVTRVHHLIPPPNKRSGNFLVNVFAFILDCICLIMIKKSDLVIALNSHLKKQLESEGFNNNLAILGAGIEIPKIYKKQKEFEAVFLGRIHPTKGVFDLPKIWQQITLKIPKARLAIVGSGPKTIEEKLKSEFVERGLKENFEFFGYLSEAKKNEILAKSKIFIFCDHEAGWGLAIGESMAAGLPVVAYKHEFLDGIFQKGIVTVPKKSTRLAAQKIIYLLKNQTARKKLGKEAKNQAKKLSWKVVADDFVKLVEKIA